MAQIIKKSNELENKYKSYRTKCICAWAVCILTFIWAAMSMPSSVFSVEEMQSKFIIVALGFGGGGMLGGYFKQKTDSYKSGVEGERTTAEIIASLPNTYCGFQNVSVTFEGKQSELDMVVVGPTGVFIIETKNLKGTVVGNYDNPQWTQKKVGQQGTPYSKNFYNPIKQVGTHVYRLANYLRSSGCPVHITPMVYFSNPETVIQLLGTPSETPVFTALGTSARDLCNYILQNPQRVSENEARQIVRLLCK